MWNLWGSLTNKIQLNKGPILEAERSTTNQQIMISEDQHIIRRQGQIFLVVGSPIVLGD